MLSKTDGHQHCHVVLARYRVLVILQWPESVFFLHIFIFIFIPPHDTYVTTCNKITQKGIFTSIAVYLCEKKIKFLHAFSGRPRYKEMSWKWSLIYFECKNFVSLDFQIWHGFTPHNLSACSSKQPCYSCSVMASTKLAATNQNPAINEKTHTAAIMTKIIVQKIQIISKVEKKGKKGNRVSYNFLRRIAWIARIMQSFWQANV